MKSTPGDPAEHFYGFLPFLPSLSHSQGPGLAPHPGEAAEPVQEGSGRSSEASDSAPGTQVPAVPSLPQLGGTAAQPRLDRGTQGHWGAWLQLAPLGEALSGGPGATVFCPKGL